MDQRGGVVQEAFVSYELFTTQERAPKVSPDSLRIAMRHYYWKPGKALFHALELEEYARAGIQFENPTMDLGCGNGLFAAMLQERGILGPIELALDYRARGLSQAKLGFRRGAIQADARALPLRSRTLASVLANGVICSVATDFEMAITEAARVLVERGLLVLSVPTPQVMESQVLPAVLRKLGAPRLASRHLSRLNRRLALFHMLDEQAWRQKLEEAHFHIEQIRYYFTPRQAFWANLLTMQLFRVFALLKIFRTCKLGEWIARLLERAFRPWFEGEQTLVQEHRHGQAGWLLIVARKRSAQTESPG
jgi:SAM-dependent methyltransferase